MIIINKMCSRVHIIYILHIYLHIKLLFSSASTANKYSTLLERELNRQNKGEIVFYSVIRSQIHPPVTLEKLRLHLALTRQTEDRLNAEMTISVKTLNTALRVETLTPTETYRIRAYNLDLTGPP